MRSEKPQPEPEAKESPEVMLSLIQEEENVNENDAWKFQLELTSSLFRTRKTYMSHTLANTRMRRNSEILHLTDLGVI